MLFNLKAQAFKNNGNIVAIISVKDSAEIMTGGKNFVNLIVVIP